MNLIVTSKGDIVLNADHINQFSVCEKFGSHRLENGVLCSKKDGYIIFADKTVLSYHKSYDGAKSALKKLYNNIANVGGIYQMEDTE